MRNQLSMRKYRLGIWIAKNGHIYYTIQKKILFFWFNQGALISNYEDAKKSIREINNFQLQERTSTWIKQKMSSD